MASNIVVGSSSSSSLSEDNQKLVCVIDVADIASLSKFDWYAFDVSDNPNHNQPPLPAIDLSIPHSLSPFFSKLPNCLLPFHEDDDYATVNLKPIATRWKDSGRGWAILGGTTKQPTTTTTLYRVCHESGCAMAAKIGNSVECIDLESFSSGGGEWKKVADLPARVAPSPVCLVLGGKLYCLGGFPTDHPSGRPGAMAATRPWAMAYDPGVENWEPLPDPPHRPVFYPIFTAAVDGQWGPCIVVPWNRLLQIYHVDAKCWELRVFDCDHIFGFPLNELVHANKCPGRAVAVEDKLYWYMANKQCLVGYDLVTKKWSRAIYLCITTEAIYQGPPKQPVTFTLLRAWLI